MWDVVREFLLSRDLWTALFYLILGAILGAIISVRYSLGAHRPKLVHSGTGSGGNQQGQSWRLSVSNQPSFLGQRVDGESARDVHAVIRVNEPKSQGYQLFWGSPSENQTTIEPGQQKTLELFHSRVGTKGYSIVDSTGEPVANFQDRAREFLLVLRDRLGRETAFRFTVEYDDSHLKQAPRLQLIFPVTLRQRQRRIRSGIREILTALRPG